MRRRFLLLLLMWGTLACTPAEFLNGVARVTQGTQFLSSLLDVADAGQRVYFARHPSMENEPKVRAAILDARLATEALDAILVSAARADAGDVKGARDKALEAYDKVYRLFHELGIPQAIPPAGGAETDAPPPRPFSLPPVEDVAAALPVS